MMNPATTIIDPHPSSSSLPVGEEREKFLLLLRKQFLLCKPPQQIEGLAEFMGNGIRAKQISERGRELYALTIGHPSSEHHQPPIQYRIAFVKHVVKQLEMLMLLRSSKEGERREAGGGDKGIPKRDYEEDDDEECVEEWYKALESFSGSGKQNEPFYRLYELPGDLGIIKIFENEGAFVAEGTTGLVTWEASVELAEWLCLHGEHEIQKRKWMVELGCGTGLLAAAVLKSFPHLSRYVSSDGHPSAVSKCKTNLEANFGSLKNDKIQVLEIDWKKDGRKFEELVRKLTEEVGPGVLLGSDIVFDPELIPALLGLIETFLQCHLESIAYIACTVRNRATLEAFTDALRDASDLLQFQEIFHWGNDRGIIYKITRSK